MDPFKIINTLVVVVGVPVAVWQLWLLRRQLWLLRTQIRDEHEWRRRNNSLTYSFSGDPELREKRSELSTKLRLSERPDGEISLDEIKQLQSQHSNIRAEIQFILGRFESMCVAMKHNLASEEVCIDLMEGSVRKYFRYFRQYIEDVRQNTENRKIYEHLEYYAKKWDDHSFSKPGKSKTGNV